MRTLGPRVRPRDHRTVKPRPKTADTFYSTPAWRQLMTRLIAERGRRCEAPGCMATDCVIYGDHIRELQDGGAPLDPNNIQLLCATHHGRKTAAERTKRRSA